MHPMYTLYTPYMHPIHTLYTPYTYPMYTLYTPYVHPICTLYTPYIHPIYTLCTPYITLQDIDDTTLVSYQSFVETQNYGTHGERVRDACWGFLCSGGACELRSTLHCLSSHTTLRLLTCNELWVPNEGARFRLAREVLRILWFMIKGLWFQGLGFRVHNPQPSTLNPQPLTLNHWLSTLIPPPSILNP